jgi:hypothetical protein
MGSNATFTNCLVFNNTHFSPAKVCAAHVPRCPPVCEVLCGCIHTRSDLVQGGGFKIVSGSSPQLTNVTIVGNSGFFAGGLYTEVRAWLYGT